MLEKEKNIKKILFDFLIVKGIISQDDIGRVILNLNRGHISDVWIEIKKI